MNLPAYAIAYGIKGFGRVSHIRVKVTRIEGQYAWCVTADLRDAGSKFVVGIDQIERERE